MFRLNEWGPKRPDRYMLLFCSDLVHHLENINIYFQHRCTPIRHPTISYRFPWISTAHFLSRKVCQLPWLQWRVGGHNAINCLQSKCRIIESSHDAQMVSRVLGNTERGLEPRRVMSKVLRSTERLTGRSSIYAWILQVKLYYHYHPKLCLQIISSGSKPFMLWLQHPLGDAKKHFQRVLPGF